MSRLGTGRRLLPLGAEGLAYPLAWGKLAQQAFA